MKHHNRYRKECQADLNVDFGNDTLFPMIQTKEAAKQCKMSDRLFLYHAKQRGIKPLDVIGRTKLWPQDIAVKLGRTRKRGGGGK